MTFIRKKKINGKDYAYLVRNKWTDKGSRQKARYLGKIVHIEILDNIDFDAYVNKRHNCNMHEYVKDHSKAEVINELIMYELERRGFKIGEVKYKQKNLIGKFEEVIDSGLTNGIYWYKSRKLMKIKSQKEVVLEMNEGFLCRWAIDKLLRAKITGYDEREMGIKLAKVLLEAGLKVDREVFVELFGKFN